MKLAIFGLLALSLALTNAAAVDPIGQSNKAMRTLNDSLNMKADQVSKDIEHKYEEVIVQPIERLEASVLAIEERKEESEECVEQQAANVEGVVQNLESTLDICAQTATTSGSAVALEIALVSIEIGNDSLNLVNGVQKCMQYTNSALKSACYAKQMINAKKLLAKTTSAVNTINESVDETVPQILVELEGCSLAAEESAVAQLEMINRNIDNCVAFLL